MARGKNSETDNSAASAKADAATKPQEPQDQPQSQSEQPEKTTPAPSEPAENEQPSQADNQPIEPEQPETLKAIFLVYCKHNRTLYRAGQMVDLSLDVFAELHRKQIVRAAEVR